MTNHLIIDDTATALYSICNSKIRGKICSHRVVDLVHMPYISIKPETPQRCFGTSATSGSSSREGRPQQQKKTKAPKFEAFEKALRSTITPKEFGEIWEEGQQLYDKAPLVKQRITRLQTSRAPVELLDTLFELIESDDPTKQRQGNILLDLIVDQCRDQVLAKQNVFIEDPNSQGSLSVKLSEYLSARILVSSTINGIALNALFNVTGDQRNALSVALSKTTLRQFTVIVLNSLINNQRFKSFQRKPDGTVLISDWKRIFEVITNDLVRNGKIVNEPVEGEEQYE